MGDTAQARSRRVFISYRRTDTAYPAGWLYDSLAERFGHAQVFKDVDSIGPGDDFVEAVTRAVSMCDVLLAVIGPKWLSAEDTSGGRRIDQPGDYVRIEIETALRRRVRVIPVLVDGATMPSADQVPSSLGGLTRRQAVELTPSRFGADLASLMWAIESTPTTSAPRPDPSRSRDRWRDDERPPSPQRPPAHESEGKSLPTVIAALACAAAGAVLMLLGAGEPLLVDGTDLYQGTTQQDIQHVVPSVVLIAAVLFTARPAVSASWLVGAAIAVLALDYASTTLWVGLRVGYEDWEVGVESLFLRTAGAAFVLIAAFVAGQAMRHSPPPIDWPSGVALAAGSVLALVGAAGQRYHLPQDMPSTAVTAAAAAPTATFLLAVGYVVHWSRSAASAAPVLTAAGGTGAATTVLELMWRTENDVPERGNVTLSVIGLSIVFGVGVALWVRARPSQRAGQGSAGPARVWASR